MYTPPYTPGYTPHTAALHHPTDVRHGALPGRDPYRQGAHVNPRNITAKDETDRLSSGIIKLLQTLNVTLECINQL